MRISVQLRHAYMMCAQAVVSGQADADAIAELGLDADLPVFTVGQAARAAGIHPQTLRQYDRLGLIVPARTEGGARRYSLRHIERLVQAQHLSQDESINLAGITRILALEEENRQLRRANRRLRRRLDGDSVFEADADGEVVEMHQSRFARLWRRGGSAAHTLRIKPLQITAARDTRDYPRDTRDDADARPGDDDALTVPPSADLIIIPGGRA